DGQSSQQTASNDVTGRELQILRLVAEGHANREIADRLYTSESTVRFHIHNLFTKLGVKRRTELVSVARQRGLV
ncbi:MAG: response regulator transcription factor, partial [Chloroflexota bacterium]